MKKQEDFTYSFTVKASAKESMKSIARVGDWWAKDFEGKAAKLKDKFTVNFGDTYVNFWISKVVPGKTITWLVTDCNLGWLENKKEWKKNQMVWILTEKDGKTKIDFTHKGMTPESDCYESCKPGWTHHIKDSLKKLIEKGKGYPE